MDEKTYTRSRLVPWGLSDPSELSESLTALEVISDSSAVEFPVKKIVTGNYTAGERALIDRGTKMLTEMRQILDFATRYTLGERWEEASGQISKIAAEWNALVDKVGGAKEGYLDDADNVEVV